MAQPEIDGQGKGGAVMIFGSDGSKWIAAFIDALGHLQIDVVASGLPGGAAEEATLAAAVTALQIIDGFADPQNLLFGYNDQVDVSVDDTFTATGWQVLDSPAVQDGEIWVIPFSSFRHTSGAVTAAVLGPRKGGTDYWAAAVEDQTITIPLTTNQTFILKKDDVIRAAFLVATQPCAAGLRAMGYKMKIA